MAATTFGWQWPVEQTAMPAAKSRKVFPSASSTIAPQARSAANGYSRVSEGDMYFASYAITSFALGPGSAVLILGSLVSVAEIMISPGLRFTGDSQEKCSYGGEGKTRLRAGDDRPSSAGALLNRRYTARVAESPGETCGAHEDPRLRGHV